MNTMFQRLASVSRQTIERVHGDAVTIFPVSDTAPNAKPSLSAEFLPYLSTALFYENTMLESEARAQPSMDGRRLMNRSLQKQASIRLIDGQPLKSNYYLRRESDQAIFIINGFDPDGMGNVLATIAAAKGLPPV
jgi:hypothetical protein